MLLSDAIKIRIKYYLKKNDMKLWQLYKNSGIPKATIYSFMKKTNALPQVDTLHHICEGLGITIREFFDDEMFEETEQD